MRRHPDLAELLKLVGAIGGIAASFSTPHQPQQQIQGPPRGTVVKDAVVLAIRDGEDDPDDP